MFDTLGQTGCNDGDHWNGNHNATKKGNGLHLINLVLWHLFARHFLALLDGRADKQIKRIIITDHAGKDAHDNAEQRCDYSTY